MPRSPRILGLTAILAVSALAISACDSDAASSTPEKTKAASATSAADFGGLDELIKAAKAEGTLNVTTLPRDWANYGQIIDNFKAEYGIKVNELAPDGSSADEIAAAKNNKGLDTAPDVFNLGATVAAASTEYFAAYKPEAWKNIPDDLKEPSGLYTAGEGGFMSIGYDSATVPEPTTIQDLLKPEYKGTVLSGDPTKNAVGLAGVGLATLQEGGKLDNFQPGIDFFAKLKKTGNLIAVQPSASTVASGETKVVLSYDYSNVAYGKNKPSWKVVIPKGTGYGSFLYQAINKDAPHPAAARLWQEYLYQAKSQNLWIASGARSPLADQLVKDGTIDKKAFSALAPAPEKVSIPTVDDSEKAGKLLSSEWASAVG